ncbi:prepilin-type N-terminal cleavage/methylation domain-containing protein [Patescibacteria group bacterium]|nr:prepilin-type N-terminal cleavage/methylation domain-containing protein [Patescibacteria group bacterium]MBU1663641.1 prepilin-type N-terminal cleavage/methylation domain-containing protein [Patescibacteria group bacterium]MBU1934228.1 prepilin-type N-terminal cleavage/methylation domain-containing protein [Patescibacteria group bacterium]MBU2007933.1 prepilin-type N-terminal cleavage/methylation domain-containing protein [Patescibacteria group bacterium]MBU2233276.1 prepilin-type N-terminal
MHKINKQTGFTLPEIMVSLAIFVMVILLTGSIFSLSQKSYKKSSDSAELTQNNRVSLDRLSRELRQSPDIITTLPPTDTDPANPPADHIIFQDGHDSSRITYIRYYLNGTDLMREHKAYYFNTDPDVYVYYNSLDAGGSPPNEINLDGNARVIGEYFNQIKFWGSNGIVNIYLKLTKNTNTFEIETSAFGRN